MKKYLLEVVKIKKETEDTKTFVFESYNENGQKEKINFQAGQYLDLFFPEDKDGHGKPYTISSAPSENLQVTVKKMGKFSGKLHGLKIGDKIELKSKSQSNVQIKEAMDSRPNAPWTTRKGFVGTFDRLPERSELNKDINEALVVEYYNK